MLHTRIQRQIFHLFLVTNLLFTPSALAFKFTPIEANLSAQGAGRSQTFEVVNENQEPLAVELTIFARSMNAAGEDQLTPADDQFVIYPTQLILMPGERQSVRLQWLGESVPDKELAYRFIAEQVPIDLSEGDSDERAGIRLLVRYVASVYVQPRQPRSELSVAIGSPAGVPSLVFSNSGNSHVLINPEQLVIRRADQVQVLPDAFVELLKGQNVLAGSERHFPLPEALASKSQGLSVELRKP